MPTVRAEAVVSKDGCVLGRFILEHGEHFIGRDIGCGVQVDLPEISSRHARLLFDAEGLCLEDLGSSNGTSLDGRQISGTVRLKLPQRIQIANALVDVSLLDTSPEVVEKVAAVLPAENPATLGLHKARNYIVKGKIAAGGMGEVLEVEDLNAQRFVAMKVIRLGGNASPETQSRFIQEARVLGRLEHPNIVPMYELGVDEKGQVFYTMKRVKGLTLQQLLDQIAQGKEEAIRQYPLSKLLIALQKVCDAVAFAHGCGVAHRDLKPANIMIGEYGEVLVMDWGLAKILRGGGETDLADPVAPMLPMSMSSGIHATMEGQIMGTPNYMAPEQAAGRIKAMDERTDIYALGGILYALLALRPPIKGGELMAILERIQSGDIRTPVSFNEMPAKRTGESGAKAAESAAFPHCPGLKIPAALSAVAMKALAVKPADRYQTVSELQSDIAAYQNGFATSAELPGVFTLGRLWMRRHRVATGAIAAIALVTIAFSVVVFSMWRELRGTAETFYDKSQNFVEQGRNQEALAPIQYALNLDAKNPKYHLARANVLQSLLRLEEAEKSYQRALDLDPANTMASQNLQLCRKIQRDNPGAKELSSASLMELHTAMIQQRRTDAANVLLRRLLAQNKAARDQFYLRWRGILDAAKIKGVLTVDDAGKVDLDLHGTPVSDLSALKGLPLISLNLANTRVRDLRPLAGMKLESLDLTHTAITNIAVLHGMPLKKLDLSDNHPNFSDLSPLAGMLLTNLNFRDTAVSDLTALMGMLLDSLDLANTRVTNLRPLAGMPLTDLSILGTAVSDLSPLVGMPLDTLNLENTPVSDVRLLAGMKLESLNLAKTPVSDIAPLRGMPLRTLNLDSTRVSDVRPLAGMKLESLNLTDIAVSNIAVLRGMPLRNLQISFNQQFSDLSPLSGMLLHGLGLVNTAVSNLTPLIGMPLDSLYLDGSKVRDLSALNGMPLRNLTLGHLGDAVPDLRQIRQLRIRNLRMPETFVSDLSPLEGMEITELGLPNTRVTDLRPLAGLALTFLNISGTDVADLTPLGKMASLLNLFMPGTKVSDISPLRGLSIKFLSINDTTVSDFKVLGSLPLTQLHLARTHFSDLRIIQNLPIFDLDLAGAEVADLAPLRQMQVVALRLHGNNRLKDVSILAECKQLERLTIPKDVAGVEKLRSLPNLRLLAYDFAITNNRSNDWSGGNFERATISESQTPAAFWKAYDARKK